MATQEPVGQRALAVRALGLGGEHAAVARAEHRDAPAGDLEVAPFPLRDPSERPEPVQGGHGVPRPPTRPPAARSGTGWASPPCLAPARDRAPRAWILRPPRRDWR